MRTPTHHHNPQQPRRILRRGLTLTAAALLTALAASALTSPAAATATSTPPGYTRSHLQHDTDTIRDLGVTGVHARVVTHDGEHIVAASGVADRATNEPVNPDGYFRIASATKTFTATVVLQLAGEGKLSLEDTVEQHLPGVVAGNGNDGRRITIRQLLQHTSGIRDNYPEVTTAEEFERQRDDLLTPEETVARAMRQRPHFAPGEGWAYSNTGYVLAGMVIQEVTGRPWHEEVNRRILRPLGLTDTYWPGTSPLLPAPHARAYQARPPRNELVDTTEHTGSFNAGAGGGLIGTTADLNRFFRALLAGELLAPGELAQMQQTVPVSAELEQLMPGASYGLGLFVRPLSCGGVSYSHEGGEAGYITANGVTPDGQRSVAVSMSSALSDTPDGPIEQEQAASRLVDHALCDAG
jgi:D-alanyl-D-alanine carboxypeptidase